MKDSSNYIKKNFVIIVFFFFFSSLMPVKIWAMAVAQPPCSSFNEVGKSGYAFTSIQDAIDFTCDGGEVLVHDGTYFENINFNKKVIAVRSENGAKSTIIDGNQEDKVVVFNSGESANSILDNFTITHGSGFGIFLDRYSSPTIINCIIANNYGRGIYCKTFSAPQITACVVVENSGGIGTTGGSSPIIADCIISNNGATSGGGIYFSSHSSPSVINCIIANNTAWNGSGIFCDYQSSFNLINCTIINNRSSRFDGNGIACFKSRVNVINSIFWNNGNNNEIKLEESVINITYSNVQGGYIGTGNIDSDPLFIDVANGNYHLKPTSPCINKGTLNNAPEYDFENDSRLSSVGGDNMPDMGVDEVIYIDTDGDAIPDSWETNNWQYYNIVYDLNKDGDVQPDEQPNRNYRDIFVYIDWLENNTHPSHRPSDVAIDAIKDAFANAPVNNPSASEDGAGFGSCDDGIDNGGNDGVDINDSECSGINLHVMYGQAIEETTGTDGNEDIGSIVTAKDGKKRYSWVQFVILKKNNLPLEMWPIFHYVIFGHNLPIFPTCSAGRPSGISHNGIKFEDGGSDFIVTLAPWNFPGPALINAEAGTFMHELGHNLGLGHGGLTLDADGKVVSADHEGYKPNYLSIMNYSFQTRGLFKRNQQGELENGYFDYSRFGSNVLPDLIEYNLNEVFGLNADNAVKDYGTIYYCQGTGKEKLIDDLQQPVNWNCNTDINSNIDFIDINPVSTNINKKDENCNEPLKVLTTVNEWPHLVYNGGAIGSAFGVMPELPETTSIEDSLELTFEEDRKIGPYVEGDVDCDGDVDRDDITILLSHRNQPASACPECDLDGDGAITVLDARKAVLLCTRDRCATE